MKPMDGGQPPRLAQGGRSPSTGRVGTWEGENVGTDNRGTAL